MNTFRLPFRWERLQPTLNQAFDATEWQRLDGFVSAATAKDVFIILDPHNYARYNGEIIGSGVISNADFADFWRRLAEAYKDNDHVIFGLMNEPKEMSTTQWVNAANAAAEAIRNTGATNLMLVPGNGWTGAHSWTQTWYDTNKTVSNASALLDFTDPGNNFAIEVHQYFDVNYSGVEPDCTSTDGSQQLTEFTAWMATHNMRGFLGEFAGDSSENCRLAVRGALQYIENNNQYWIGWTWWAAGPWWGPYMYSVEPTANGDAPQMQWFAPFLP